MYGFSYQGHTQLLALAAGRPELAALCPGMATWDVRTDWAYEGGAFCFANNLYWGLQMAAERPGKFRARPIGRSVPSGMRLEFGVAHSPVT